MGPLRPITGVYRIVDGADPDWASWYADWLVNLSELTDCSARGRSARADLPSRQPRQAIQLRGSGRAVGGLLRPSNR